MNRDRQTVLVVDDNLQNRLVAEGHLTASGYEVRLAEGGEAAVRMFEEWGPDLVLLDVLMPGIDGFETCARLRNAPRGKDAAIIFLTALSDLGTHQAALASGADDFITKPINRTELLMRVRSLLWIKRLKDELMEGYEVIRSQRDALLAARRGREELTSLLVHDLKNPLASIMLNGQLLLEDATPQQEQREIVDDVLIAAATMHRLVMNLLDISRSEDGVLEPRRSVIDLPGLLAEVRTACCRSATSRAQEVEVAVDPDVATVIADVDLLRRLLDNLVVNAIKYSPRGTTVRVEASVSGGALELRVRDEGPGVDPSRRENIFEKYARIEPGDEQTATSCGLGLRFCRLAVAAHGGRIWVEENEPRGSVFRVLIPIG